MKAVRKFLLGGAAMAAATLVFAAPAAAQYYPGYGGGSGNVLVGAILDSILRGNAGYGGYGGGYGGYGGGYGGYGGYGGNAYVNQYQRERYAVDVCARATEARLNGGRYGGYGAYGYAPAVRVAQIDRVERRSRGVTKVWGQAGATGYRGNYGAYNAPYGGYGAPYGAYAAGPQYRFECRVDSRGRVADLDIDRNRYGYRY